MADFIEFIKKTFEGTELNITNHWKIWRKNICYRKTMGQNALIQSIVFEQAKNTKGDTIEGMDI